MCFIHTCSGLPFRIETVICSSSLQDLVFDHQSSVCIDEGDNRGLFLTSSPDILSLTWSTPILACPRITSRISSGPKIIFPLALDHELNCFITYHLHVQLFPVKDLPLCVQFLFHLQGIADLE